MKIIVVLFSMLTITSSVFAFGDEFFMQISEISEMSTEHHHHISVEEHEEEHGNKEHSQDCEDECHFCVFTGVPTNVVPPIFQIEFEDFGIRTASINANYTSLYANNYLATLLQPPQD
jgi:hypothetical protein